MNDLKFRQFLKPNFHHNGESFHYWGYIDGSFISPMGKNECVVDSEQFTGLKDRNGVDIYKNDIVTWGDTEGYEEVSGTRYALVDVSKPENGLTFSSFKPFVHDFKIGNFAYANSTEKCMTVIGNIHQHKHLLEK